MGGCFSTPLKGKKRRRRYHKTRRVSANFVIPVSGLSLESATLKYDIGRISVKDLADRGLNGAFLVERPEHEAVNINKHFDHENALQQSPRTLKGSKEESFFDLENYLNAESDDEYMSVCGDFTHSAEHSLSYPHNNLSDPERPSFTALQAAWLKVDSGIAGTSQRATVLDSPFSEDGQVGLSNGPSGLVALAGSIPARAGDLNHSVVASSQERLTVLAKSLSDDGRTASEPSVRRHSDASQGSHRAHSMGSAIGDAGKAGESTNKGVFESSCLPLLRTAVSFNTRSSPLSSQKRKGGISRFSFKKHEKDVQDELEASTKFVLERPLAGSQIPCCSSDKPVDGCWSAISPPSFKLRGKNFSKYSSTCPCQAD